MMNEIPGVRNDGLCVCLPAIRRVEPGPNELVWPRSVSVDCVCGTTERMLRLWQANLATVAPMTAEQRAWCKQQVQGVEGGDWPGDEAPDDQVAGAVLDAWRTYCRDKGIY